MDLWLCYHALLAVLVGAQSGIHFQNSTARCLGENQRCVSIFDCAAFSSKRAILERRPTPCGFSGTTVLVCCTIQQPPTTLALLPSKCGNPNRTISVPRTAPPRRRNGSGGSAGYGGSNSVPGKWPWMALFGRWTDGRLNGWFCGGTLITRQHVLTAAHCLRPDQAGAVGVRVGDRDLATPFDVQHQDRNVSRITRHERYRGSQNDIALVRLDAPVRLTDAVRPICLPPAEAEYHGRHVEMAGWGLLEFAGDTPDILQEVPLRVTDEADCERAYRQVPTFQTKFPGGFQGTKICALSRDDTPRDACPGDSGGPLMADRPDGLYELVGVVSTGVACGNPEFPGIYTKVSRYIHWILRNHN